MTESHWGGGAGRCGRHYSHQPPLVSDSLGNEGQCPSHLGRQGELAASNTGPSPGRIGRPLSGSTLNWQSRHSRPRATRSFRASHPACLEREAVRRRRHQKDRTRRHLTEGCVFRLEPTDSGAITLELIEITPSIDPERTFPRYA